MAQPVPVRELPAQPWSRIGAGALTLLLIMLAAWEWHWRDFGAIPSIRSTDALWAIQRRRIDSGDGGATVLVGDSRMYYDVQLQVWERLEGRRPIQLSFEGTSPVPFIEDLAADPHFTGRLLVNVAPIMYFNNFGRRAAALKYFRDESPAQRVGQWLSMRAIEPLFAFNDPDFALATVLERQPWPARRGMRLLGDVRKISITEPDRNSHLWDKVASDPGYRAIVQSVWQARFGLWRLDPPPAKIRANIEAQIERTAKAVLTLRARGVEVLFVRLPSSGPFLEIEDEQFPRAATWNSLLAATGAPGIHFEDYPQLQGLELPEWSHLSQADATRLTEALYRIVERDFWPKDR